MNIFAFIFYLHLEISLLCTRYDIDANIVSLCSSFMKCVTPFNVTKDLPKEKHSKIS
jgi:hypothetical protein